MTYKELLESKLKKAQLLNKEQADSNAKRKEAMAEQIALQDTALKHNAQTQKKDVASTYRELYDENAVNQYVSERRVAESMANLGLTNSGLNRTQQTAIALTRGNADSRTRVAEQMAIDSIEQSLKSGLAQNKARLDDYSSQLDEQLTKSSEERYEDAYSDASKEYQNYTKANNSSNNGSGSSSNSSSNKTQSSSSNNNSSDNYFGTVAEGTANYEDIYSRNLKSLTSVMYSQEERGINESALAAFAQKYIIDYCLTKNDMKFLISKFGIEDDQLPQGFYDKINKEQKRLRDVLLGFDEYEKSLKTKVDFDPYRVFEKAFSQYKISEYGGAKLIPQLVANGYLTTKDGDYIRKLYEDVIKDQLGSYMKVPAELMIDYVDQKEKSGAVSHYGALYMRALLMHYELIPRW